uniref:Coluporin-19 n=1 Tax=Colubraria reticulata TaxID=604273 RepID=A0A499RQG5_9CAEN|nr:coluporin-19 [Colubraria reticulata]
MALQFPKPKTLWMIFLFVIGFPTGRSTVSGYSVTADITVENLTPYPLVEPVLRLSDGVKLSNPVDIQSNRKGTFNLRKKAITATGTYGTVSWLVSENNRRFIVMWSVPYDTNLYRNWLGLGMTTVGHTYVPIWDVWFGMMYYDIENSYSKYLTYVNKKFEKKDLKPLNLRLASFNMTGTMTNSGNTQIMVKFQITK